MEVKRDAYLNKLKRKMKNGLVKVVTGARQCGKSYLLTHLFHDHLRSIGVPEDHIIEIALDDGASKALRDPDVILDYIRGLIKDAGDYFVVIDEVQHLSEFEDVLNSLLHIRNADVYVTGGSAKFLSTDVITQFRGRGDEIHVYPLSFSEFLSGCSGTQDEAWDDYLVYGGMPLVLTMAEAEDKADYLSSLFRKVYLSDIVKRHNVRNKAELDELVDVLASAIGSYTNPTKLVRTFKSSKGATISDKTIKNYIDYLVDSFLISNAPFATTSKERNTSARCRSTTLKTSVFAMRDWDSGRLSRRTSWKTSSTTSCTCAATTWTSAWWSAAERAPTANA